VQKMCELRELSLLRLSSQRRYRLASGGLGAVSGGVGVPKLSKLLNQEDALSAPLLKRFAITMAR
jgi:hypothetical protein